MPREVIHVDVLGQVLRIETDRDDNGEIEMCRVSFYEEARTMILSPAEARRLQDAVCPRPGPPGNA